MSKAENTTKQTSQPLFLLEPEIIAELDSWIAHYQQRQSRFTFSEADALADIWQQGEDIRLREDKRFRQVPLVASGDEAHWYLAIHTLANEYLYEILFEEAWDGQNLYQQLEQYDKEEKNIWHVFCPCDRRFNLSGDAAGIYHLTLCEPLDSIFLTTEQKEVADTLASQLLEHILQQAVLPFTTVFLLQSLQQLASTNPILQSIQPQALENWLLRQGNWTRVGSDTWMPTSKIPIIPEKHRYTVVPLASPLESTDTTLPPILHDQALTRETAQVLDHAAYPASTETEQQYIHWRVTLRTCHINEGYIPVPPRARAFYPHVPGLTNIIATQGLLFDDNSQIILWLDRKQHRLFGSNLEEYFVSIEAGTILDIRWNTSGIVIASAGVDSQVAEEEMRLIDLSSLAQQRRETLENYRASLRIILNESATPLRFHDLYLLLSQRQHHKPNSATIRSILSSSPEFVFDKTKQQWMLNTSTTLQATSRHLLGSLIVAKHLDHSLVENEQTQLSLTQMITESRQRLARLRSHYQAD